MLGVERAGSQHSRPRHVSARHAKINFNDTRPWDVSRLQEGARTDGTDLLPKASPPQRSTKQCIKCVCLTPLEDRRGDGASHYSYPVMTVLAIVVTPWPIKGGPRLQVERSTPSSITRCSCIFPCTLPENCAPCNQSSYAIKHRAGVGFYAHSGPNLDKSPACSCTY
jgi:hypothetical protein